MIFHQPIIWHNQFYKKSDMSLHNKYLFFYLHFFTLYSLELFSFWKVSFVFVQLYSHKQSNSELSPIVVCLFFQFGQSWLSLMAMLSSMWWLVCPLRWSLLHPRAGSCVHRLLRAPQREKSCSHRASRPSAAPLHITWIRLWFPRTI